MMTVIQHVKPQSEKSQVESIVNKKSADSYTSYLYVTARAPATNMTSFESPLLCGTSLMMAQIIGMFNV